MERIFSSYLQRKARLSRGFTLIELLVVIAIIGVLASIVLASLNNARIKSRDARRITDIKQIQLALELFFDSNNGYPPASTSCVTGGAAYGLEALQAGGHIPQVPRDSIAGCHTYASLTAAPRTTYHLGAVLRDITNNALTGDSDFNSNIAGWTNGFHGLDNKSTEGGPCGITGGTAQPGGTETCYDVRP